MKAALKYPVFYLAPAEHMVYVFWREENVTTRRLLAEAKAEAEQRNSRIVSKTMDNTSPL